MTGGNFLRASAIAIVFSLLMASQASMDPLGAGYAVASGALASGIGYVLWYMALPSLRPTTAATVQLSVPVLAALGGIAWLGEATSLRVLLASAAILGGIGLVILGKRAGNR